MNVKIDTKHKFVEITTDESILTANMAEELKNILLKQLDEQIPHVIFNAENIKEIDSIVISAFCKVKEKFTTANASLVFCSFETNIYKVLEAENLVEHLNVTPTLSEAWDIIQMEEIERELLSDFEEETE